MSPRLIAISAVAALAALGGLFLLVRGGGGASAGPVAAEAAGARVLAARQVKPPAPDIEADAGTRLIASHGPYGDPFAAPPGATGASAPGEGGAPSEGGTQATGTLRTSPVPTGSPAPPVGKTPSAPAPSRGSPADPAPAGKSRPPKPNAEPPTGTPPGAASADVPAVKPSVTPPVPHEAPVATLRLVVPGRSPRTVNLEAEGVIPSRANPLLAVLRVTPHRRRVVLMPAADVRPEGRSRCAPSIDRCRRLTLTVGQLQLLEATSEAGRPVRYRLRLIEVR